MIEFCCHLHSVASVMIYLCFHSLKVIRNMHCCLNRSLPDISPFLSSELESEIVKVKSLTQTSEWVGFWKKLHLSLPSNPHSHSTRRCWLQEFRVRLSLFKEREIQFFISLSFRYFTLEAEVIHQLLTRDALYCTG